jgi:glycosyltransferase involved in cell wall biosynthesis
VVFNHGRYDYLEALLFIKKPLLHQFHSPVDQFQVDFLEKRIRGSAAFLFISNSQCAGLEVSTPAFVVPNPIDSEPYELSGQSGGYLVFLGRLTHNKGVDIAIAVARQSGRRLVIAGNISDEKGGADFFEKHIQPYLDGVQITWVGPVNNQQKRDLLGHADALLFPIRWDEPFGLVMVEALACGCPVIATRRASTPEVIDHGVTGFLCDPSEPSVDSFLKAIARLPEIDRNNCILIAQSRFGLPILAPRVLNVLQKLVDSRL